MDKNLITTIDEEKIQMALDKGVFNSYIVNTNIESWKLGHKTVDEVLREEDGDYIIDLFPNWKSKIWNLTSEQFEEIVQIVKNEFSDIQEPVFNGVFDVNEPLTSDYYKIKDVETLGCAVLMYIESYSEKTLWGVQIDFCNSRGQLSSRYRLGHIQYPGSLLPYWFANEVVRQMKYYIESRTNKYSNKYDKNK